MGVFGALFGCRGDGGFNACCSGARSGDDGFTMVCISSRRGVVGFSGPLLWVCRGDAGFNVAMLPRLVCDIRRPARPDAGASAKKLALRHCSHRVSAKKFAQHTKNGSKWLFYAALGELLRGNGVKGLVLGELLRGNAAGGAVRGELLRGNAAGGAVRGGFFADQQSWDPAGRVCCAVRLAAGPVYWQP